MDKKQTNKEMSKNLLVPEIRRTVCVLTCVVEWVVVRDKARIKQHKYQMSDGKFSNMAGMTAMNLSKSVC